METKTHISFAAFFALCVASFLNWRLSVWEVSFVALGCLLPDIDSLGPIERRFGSATIGHSLLSLGAIAVIVSPLFFLGNLSIASCILIGYLSHLLLDSATKEGVLLLYPSRIFCVFPQNERLRAKIESALQKPLFYIFIILAAILIPLNQIGIRGLLHLLIRTPQAAVEDYTIFTHQGYEAYVELDGIYQLSQRRIKGKWLALAPTSNMTLLLQSPDGQCHTAGAHPEDNIKPMHMLATKGRRIKVSTNEVTLRGVALSDVFQYIPKEGRTYITGYIKTFDHARVTYSLDSFKPCKPGIERIDFFCATKDDILAQRLEGIMVGYGQFILRTVCYER